MGEITRLHEADIVPFAPNDATDVSNELTNIVNNGVNDNWNAGTSDTYDGDPGDDLSIIHNANRAEAAEDRLDDLDLASPDGRVSVNEDDIDAVEARLDLLENATQHLVVTSSFQVEDDTAPVLRVIYASAPVTITFADLSTFALGQEFIIEASLSTYVTTVEFGSLSLVNGLETIPLRHGDILRCEVALNNGSNRAWRIWIETAPEEPQVYTVAAGATYNMPDQSDPAWLKGVFVDALTANANTTVVMPPLAIGGERGDVYNFKIECEENREVLVYAHADDSSTLILRLTDYDDETEFAGQIIGTQSGWFAFGFERKNIS